MVDYDGKLETLDGEEALQGGSSAVAGRGGEEVVREYCSAVGEGALS